MDIPRTLIVPHQLMIIDDGNDVVFVLRSVSEKATLTKADLDRIARYVWDIATRQAQLDG